MKMESKMAMVSCCWTSTKRRRTIVLILAVVVVSWARPIVAVRSSTVEAPHQDHRDEHIEEEGINSNVFRHNPDRKLQSGGCCSWDYVTCPGNEWCDAATSQCETQCDGIWIEDTEGCCSWDDITCPREDEWCDGSRAGCEIHCGGSWKIVADLPPPPVLVEGAEDLGSLVVGGNPGCCTWDGSTCPAESEWCDESSSNCEDHCDGSWMDAASNSNLLGCCSWDGTTCPGGESEWCDESSSNCMAHCDGNWINAPHITPDSTPPASPQISDDDGCCSWDDYTCPEEEDWCNQNSSNCHDCEGNWINRPDTTPGCCSWDYAACAIFAAEWCEISKSTCETGCGGVWLDEHGANADFLACKPLWGDCTQDSDCCGSGVGKTTCIRLSDEWAKCMDVKDIPEGELDEEEVHAFCRNVNICGSETLTPDLIGSNSFCPEDSCASSALYPSGPFPLDTTTTVQYSLRDTEGVVHECRADVRISDCADMGGNLRRNLTPEPTPAPSIQTMEPTPDIQPSHLPTEQLMAVFRTSGANDDDYTTFEPTPSTQSITSDGTTSFKPTPDASASSSITFEPTPAGKNTHGTTFEPTVDAYASQRTVNGGGTFSPTVVLSPANDGGGTPTTSAAGGIATFAPTFTTIAFASSDSEGVNPMKLTDGTTGDSPATTNSNEDNVSEDDNGCTSRVTAFFLVDALTDKSASYLFPVISFNQILPTKYLNVKAFVKICRQHPIKSVAFSISGQGLEEEGELWFCDNHAPFSLFGDVSGKYHGKLLPVGEYTLTATPYEYRECEGLEYGTLSHIITFTE